MQRSRAASARPPKMPCMCVCVRVRVRVRVCVVLGWNVDVCDVTKVVNNIES